MILFGEMSLYSISSVLFLSPHVFYITCFLKYSVIFDSSLGVDPYKQVEITLGTEIGYI